MTNCNLQNKNIQGLNSRLSQKMKIFNFSERGAGARRFYSSVLRLFRRHMRLK